MTKRKNQPSTLSSPISTATASQRYKGIIDCIRQNKTDGLILTGLLTVIYFVISHYYPAPSGTADTPNYIHCAITKEIGGYRPYGYSAFLGMVHDYSQTAKAVFTAQFILFAISVLYLYYAVRLVFSPKNLLMRALLILAFLASPCTIYLTNYLMSDSLSSSLTSIWLASLLCFAYNKNLGSLAIHFIIMFFCIEVRYSAMLYPLFTVSTIILVYRKSLLSSLALIPLVITFMIHSKTVRQTKKMSGVAEFSAFSGWQLANNALIIHPYTQLSEDDFPTEDLKAVHRVVKSIPDSVYIKNGIIAGYMWDNDKALKQYHYLFRSQNNMAYLKAFIMCGGIFRQYGQVAVKKRPVAFLQHYYIPNLVMMFDLPDTDILGKFMPQDLGTGWFSDLENNKLKAPENDIFFNYFTSPILTGNKIRLILFCITVLVIAFLLIKKGPWLSREQRLSTFMLLSFTLISLAFLVFAAPSCLRYILMVTYPIHLLMYIAINYSFFRKTEAIPVKTQPAESKAATKK